MFCSPDIFMEDTCHLGCYTKSKRYLIKPGLKDFFDDSMLKCTVKGGSLFSLYQLFFTNLFFLAQDGYATSVSLLRVFEFINNLDNIIFNYGIVPAQLINLPGFQSLTN